MVRAKFRCNSITEFQGGKSYNFNAPYGSEENKKWAAATPNGKLEITINNHDAQKFEVGKHYYLDFSPAE